MGLPPPVVDHLGNHHGTASRAELLALGYTPTEIRGWVRAGLLVRLARGVYAAPGSVATPQRHVRAVVLRGGRDAVAVDEVARWCHGLGQGPPPRRPTVATPTDRSPVQGVDLRDLAVRYVRRDVPQGDRQEIDSIPTLTRVATVFAVAALGNPGQTRITVDAALRAGEELQALVDAARGRPDDEGAAAFLALWHQRVFRQESEEERRFDRDVIAHVEPAAEWQRWLRPSLRPDVLWRSAWLTGEWDGERWHTDALAREADRARDRRCRAIGFEVARFRDEHLIDPPATVAALQQLLDVRTEFFATEAGKRISGTVEGGTLPRTMYPKAARDLLAP